jgi:4-amino-4-deoxy-L-arabinose transferase-like glycosyltransferase
VTDDASSPRRLRDFAATDKRLLAAGLVVAVVVRIVCWQGLGYLDSLNYAAASLRVLDEGVGTGLGFHQVDRLGMTLPPAAFLAVLGRSEASIVAYFLLLALVELAVVPMLLARRFAPRTVVVATLLYAFAPMAIRDSTTNSADLAMSVWANVAILALLTAPPGRRVGWCAAAGLLLGVACLHKETAVVLGPVAAAAAFFSADDGAPARLKRVAALGVGFAVPLLVEAALFRAWTGDPLFRYRHIEETHGASLGVMETAPLAMRYLVYWPSSLIASPQTFGALIFVLPGALLVHALDRFRVCGPLVALWLLFPALYTVFGSSTLSAWRPLLPYPRYLHVALLPGAVLAAQALVGDGGLLRTTARRAAVIVAAAAMLVAACAIKFRGVDGVVAGGAALLLVVAACRSATPRIAMIAAVLCLVPLEMAVERAVGRTSPSWALERRAVAAVRAAGFTEIRSASPVSWALQMMSKLGETPGMSIESAPPDELASTPAHAAVVAWWSTAAPILAVKGADGAPAFEEIASFPAARFPRDGGVRVLVRRR